MHGERCRERPNELTWSYKPSLAAHGSRLSLGLPHLLTSSGSFEFTFVGGMSQGSLAVHAPKQTSSLSRQSPSQDARKTWWPSCQEPTLVSRRTIRKKSATRHSGPWFP